MAWAAIALPIAQQVLGMMSKDKQGEQQPQQPAPPSMGQIFSANDQKYQNPGFSTPNFGASQIIKTGGNGGM